MRKKFFGTSSFLGLGVLFALASCSVPVSSSTSQTGSNSSTGSPSSKETSSNNGIGSSSSSQSLSSSSSSSSSVDSLSYSEFWEASSEMKISLSFSDSSLKALSDYGANYNLKYADVYFPADFTLSYKGKSLSFDEVGVRMKGNNSREEITDSKGKITGSCHFKVSFKATFDDSMYDLSKFSSFKHDWSNDSLGRKARKKRRLAEMEKIDLKYLPRNDGKTYSQEIYSFDVFRTNGVEAPYARWSTLSLSDDSSSKTSAYEVVEAMDDVFLTHHFSGDDSGDLYKCSTYSGSSQGSYIKADLSISGAVSKSYDTSGLANGTRVSSGKIGVEDNYSLYHPNYQLKTNDDGENSDFSKMASFINGVYNIRYKEAPCSLLDSLFDVDNFLKMEALSYCLGNYDDQGNNYNNYFIYFRTSDDKAVYIPYDWDWSLGATISVDTSSWKPYHVRTSHDDKSTNSLYWITILTSSGLSYSETDMRKSYADYVRKCVDDGYLDSKTYTSFCGSLAGSTHEEYSDVSSFMSARKNVIAGS